MRPLVVALERLLELSEAMVGAGETEDWERLVELGEARDAIVNALPADLHNQLFGPEKAIARTLIERYQVLDAKTRELIEERQQSLRVLLRETVS